MVPNSFTLDSLHIRHLERWTVLMYSKNCNAELVNDARKLMSSHNLRSLDSTPPTKNALFLHIKGVLLVAAMIWKQSLSKTQISQNPVNEAGNGTPGQKSGYHMGQICRTSARHARCSSAVAVVLLVRETVTATQLDSDVAVFASAKEVAQIMTKKAEFIMAMMCAVYYPWTFCTNIFLTIKLKHYCRKHICTARQDSHIWLSLQIRSDLDKSDHT